MAYTYTLRNEIHRGNARYGGGRGWPFNRPPAAVVDDLWTAPRYYFWNRGALYAFIQPSGRQPLANHTPWTTTGRATRPADRQRRRLFTGAGVGVGDFATTFKHHRSTTGGSTELVWRRPRRRHIPTACRGGFSNDGGAAFCAFITFPTP